MNLTTPAINEIFSICKTSIVDEILKVEQALAEERRLENIRLKEEYLRENRIRNSIDEHFANLKQMVKDVFSEPSELSQFLLEKVLNKCGQQSLSRRTMVEKGPAKLCPEIGGFSAIPMKMIDINFQLIDLVEIDSLSSERSRFFIGLGIPSLGFQVDAKSLCQAEPITYVYRKAEGGALFVEEFHIYTSFSKPANSELRNVLKNLCDFKMFCHTILKKYQHLITS